MYMFTTACWSQQPWPGQDDKRKHRRKPVQVEKYVSRLTNKKQMPTWSLAGIINNIIIIIFDQFGAALRD